MRRKRKKSKSVILKYNKNIKKTTNGDCIYIGKENMDRWTELKTKFNFKTNGEFTSYLLELFVSEKCKFTNGPLSTTSNLPSNKCEQDISSSKICVKPLKITSSSVKNCSSVIVINKASKTDEAIENSQVIEHHTNTFEELPNKYDVQEQMKKDISKLEHSSDLLSENSSKYDRKLELKTDNISSCRAEPSHKIMKKKKNCNLKRKLLSVNEKSSIHQKKAVDESSCKRSNTDLHDKEKEQLMEDPIMISEITDSNLNTDPKTTSCERVAITIKLCEDCDLHHVQDACPLRKPTSEVQDAVTQAQWSYRNENGDTVHSYAEESLPGCLELRPREGEDGCYIVIAREPIQAFFQFGPLVGDDIKEKEIPDDATMEHIWELCDSNGCHYLSTSDPKHSNWLRYVRPAPVRSTRNLEVILRNNQLVFVTTTAVNTGDELLFWAENTNTAWSQKKLSKTKCGGCNLSFSHTLYYRLHCAVFHDPAYSLTVRKYHCKVCGLSVLGKENIIKHVADSHNGKGAYQCQFCHKFFLRLNYLEMHRTYGCSANPNRARPLCDYCGRKFCQPQKLKVHIKRMHSEMLEVLRDFQCQQCLKVLGSRPALQRHIREVHQKDVVGASTCDRCGKMFQNKSNLKIHMLTHSGIKPFKCKERECQGAFTTKQCLQLHYRKVHGLEASHMPHIERSVEYTFDAYSGSRIPNTDSQSSNDGAKNGSLGEHSPSSNGYTSTTPQSADWTPAISFDGYSGNCRPNSVNTDSQCSSDGEDTPDKCINEDLSLSPPISVTGDPLETIPFGAPCRTVVSKGSKKWMGESSDNGKASVFDFDDDDRDQDINVSQIDEEPIPMLMHHCKQDSTNASLLVEAALDAAEREIDIPAKISSPIPLVSRKESYSVLKDNVSHSPLSLSRPVTPLEYQVHDQSQSPHLPMDTCYSTSMSPRHPYNLMFPERSLHYDFRFSPPPSQMETFHLDEPRYEPQRRSEDNSGDEGLSEAQNLSLGLKSKPLQLEIPYKYDSPEERSFETVEGLDMSRTSNYHHPFVSVAPRYPHAVYEPRTYSHTDVLRVVNFSHSVDLSLPRSHHQLTSPISQNIMEPIRLLPSPPPLPLYQAYPLSTSPYNRPHSPTYHHYSTTY